MNQDGEQLIIEIELQIKRFFNKNNYKKKNKIIKKNQRIKMIKDKKSRWATIYKNYPQVVMTEKDVWLPAEDT